MKIYDTFPFFNELDLLEIRLNILDPVVDEFVLVEATKTFQNRDKPLFFDENKARYAGFLHKITHVIVDDMPASDNTRLLEAHQRNAIVRGLSNCVSGDQILLSDLDEIPNPDVIQYAATLEGVKAFKQSLHYYYVNYVCDEMADLPWTIMAGVEYFNLPQALRQRLISAQAALLGGGGSADVTLIEDGGWHFSYLGGLDAILRKLEAFADPEYNKEIYRDTDRIARALANGDDLFGRDLHFKKIALNEGLPVYLLEHSNRIRHLIHD